ncbi:cyclophilin-like fold protein [Mannheimia indoligenes]|uniref:cyclophilin-like fold protein n=1 Tax=Mannheimia indoligenes TaxID=3103145 RepID=UPI002FE6BFCB
MNRLLLPLILMLTAAACSAESPATGQSNAQNPNTQNLKIQEKTMSQNPVSVSINNQVFEVQLENNQTAQSFANLLPLDLVMKDHLNNEKFATLPNALPTNDKTAGQIHAGDVMLYQGDTVVIFYENFDSNYRYTKIGRISNADTLKQTLGRGDVQVKWNAK